MVTTMSREKQDYRDNLEELLRFTGGRHLMTAKEVGAYCGIDQRTAARRYSIPKTGISVPTLARMMSSM